MALTRIARLIQRGRVGGPSVRPGRPRRAGIETLEGRLCLTQYIPPTWTPIGPAPITDPLHQNLDDDGDYVNPPEITGAVQALATFTTRGGTQGAYVGGALGGIWRTDDLFADSPQWVNQSDGLPSPAIDSLALSPLDPTGDTAFAGTGPTSNGGYNYNGYFMYFDQPAQLSAGLYRTTDGGRNWTALNDATSPIQGAFITRVVPTTLGQSVDGETVLAGTDRGLFIAADGGSTFSAPSFTRPVLDVIADPVDPRRFYLLAGPDHDGKGAGVYRSDDVGQSWKAIDDGLSSDVLDLIPPLGSSGGAGRLAATVVDGQTLLYMTFERSDNQNTYGVFRTAIADDGTAEWETYFLFDEGYDGGGNNNLGLAIDPSDPDVVYTTGYGDNRTFRIAPDPASGAESEPGPPGATELTNEDDGSLYDGRALAFATDPQGQETLLLASDSGVYSLPNPTAATKLPQWAPRLGNLGVNETYALAAMPGPDGSLYVAGGSQDTATYQGVVAPGQATTWVAINGGDGYGASYDPGVGMVYATSDTITGLQVVAAATNAIQDVTFTNWYPDDVDDDSGFPNFAVVSAADVGDANTPRPVVFAQNGLYEAQPSSLASGTVTLARINAPLDTFTTYSAISFGGTYQGAPDPFILYAARGDGTLWVDQQYGAQATQVSSWSHGVIVGLAQDPANSHHVFALTSTALYVSQDAGQTWVPYASQPPSDQLGPFLSLGIVPARLDDRPVNVLLVGGLRGVQVLPDDPGLAQGSWYRADWNLPTTWVTSFAYVPGRDALLLSTMGRGDWLLSDASTQLLWHWYGQTETRLEAPPVVQGGVPVILTARVRPTLEGHGTPAGMVSFYDATGTLALLGTARLDADGVATLLLPHGLPARAVTLRAFYRSENFFDPSHGDARTTGLATPTTVTLEAPPSAWATEPVTLRAVVFAPGGGDPPAGLVTFFDGGRALGTVAVDPTGVATLTIPPPAIGPHSLSAAYQPAPGSPDLAGQTASATPLGVVAVTTTTTLEAPGLAWTFSPVTLSATVVAAGGGRTPAGLVTFSDGGQPLGTVALDANGTAVLTVPALGPGAHALTAAYEPGPGSRFVASRTAGASTLQVGTNPTVPVATATTLSAGPLAPSALEGPPSRPPGRRGRGRVVLGARVTSPLAGPPSGLVGLQVNGRGVAMLPLDPTGRAIFSLRGRLRNKSVVAVFLGGTSGVTPLLPSRSAALVLGAPRPLVPLQAAATSPRPHRHHH